MLSTGPKSTGIVKSSASELTVPDRGSAKNLPPLGGTTVNEDPSCTALNVSDLDLVVCVVPPVLTDHLWPLRPVSVNVTESCVPLRDATAGYPLTNGISARIVMATTTARPIALLVMRASRQGDDHSLQSGLFNQSERGDQLQWYGWSDELLRRSRLRSKALATAQYSQLTRRPLHKRPETPGNWL